MLQPARFPPGPPSLQVEWPIELLRIVAACMVMLAHYLPPLKERLGLGPVFPLWFLYTGVNLFFVLSGYVFAPQLLNGVGRLGTYAVRRFCRIYPLYLVALALHVGLAIHGGRPVLHLGEHLFLLQTLESRAVAYYYNIVFWSLPPEVEFYAALPLLAMCVRGGERRLWLLCGAALVLDALISTGLPAPTDPETTRLVLSVHLPGLLGQFLLGVMAWRAVRAAPGRRTCGALLAAGCVLWLLCSWLFDVVGPGAQGLLRSLGEQLSGRSGTLSAACFALMVTGLVGGLRGGPVGYGCPSPWLVRASLFGGSLTYGIYLFHNGVQEVLAPRLSDHGPWCSVMACIVLTLALAYLFSRTVELPCRRFGRRWGSCPTGERQVPHP